ncbi:hypothetical protein CLV98_105136 [Dyadobacter jejuensis]|uniref:DUF5018 domain-containing protein n=1 Tax=Dyadobacter jejuensis TaxID=1082580 RepID=A0A316AJW6_9BACT|nr:hypothetical protein [Dyadobacter jejuensis]PWJ57956.1 hypothetical protein CLV98_105136 [Dyadobacter jejuensis]
MKNLFKYGPLLFITVLMSSCLKANLEVLPVFSDAEITNFRLEYRWVEGEEAYGKLHVVQLPTKNTIDSETNTIISVITLPAASASFPESERSKVSLQNVVGYADLSTAASMHPIGDAPVLGKPGDFSKDNLQYEVVAADGQTKKVWKLTLSGL